MVGVAGKWWCSWSDNAVINFATDRQSNKWFGTSESKQQRTGDQ